MRVNLKKAAALASAVAAVATKFDHAYSVDIHGDLPTQEFVDKATSRLSQQIENALGLLDIVYFIRHRVNVANRQAINELLTVRVRTEKKLAVLNTIPVREAGTNLVILGRQLEAAKNADKPYGNRVPDFTLETESLLTPRLKALRRELRDIDDQLQALNFNTTIELPEDVVKVLTDLDLV